MNFSHTRFMGNPLRNFARGRMILGFCLGLTGALARAAEPAVTLHTDTAYFTIGQNGALSGIIQQGTGRNYLAPGQPAPLLSVMSQGRLTAPTAAEFESATSELTLRYDRETRIHLKAMPHGQYVTFEVLSAEPAAQIDAVVWGPYPSVIGETIGETVGVVRNREFALGIQTLNVKTLGGFPTSDSDNEGETSADDHGLYPNLPAELLKGQHYRTDTARGTDFGSVLQAYCRNRTRELTAPNWGQPKYRIPAFQDGGIIGSKIALFACPEPRALETIGVIEVAEGLPHPMIDGVWGKTSPGATASYLIVDFGEDTIDRAIEMTRRAGLKYLYHSSPFETWGHFQLKKKLFPHGWDGLRTCSDKARLAGIRLGVHTLSNFITPNDPFVTPKPDPRLAEIGSAPLAQAITETEKEIPVASPDYFTKKSALNTVRLGAELVRYSGISTQAPWRLLECERGAWGTMAQAHSAGEPAARLLDHDYKVFLSHADLSLEIARQIASLFNHAHLQQISFDGLEGNWSTGYGKYGCALFVKAWFDALDPELRGTVINDASLSGHYSWHINTRMNWGEPWYGGFRESQTLYRFKNQVYFERNLMPHMLGWFALRPDTSVEDAEWLLARAAGFDAGFTLAASLASTAQLEADPTSAETARHSGAVPAILAAIKQWETARMRGAFSPEMKAKLRDNTREFHLEARTDSTLQIQEIQATRFTHDAAKTAPSTFNLPVTPEGQSFQLIVHAAAKQPIAQLVLAWDGQPFVHLGTNAVPAGGNVRLSRPTEAVLTDGSWHELTRLPVTAPPKPIGQAGHTLEVSCAQQEGATVKIEWRTLEAPVAIGK